MQIVKGFKESTSSSSRFSWHVIAFIGAGCHECFDRNKSGTKYISQSANNNCDRCPKTPSGSTRSDRASADFFRTKSASIYASCRHIRQILLRPDSELKHSPQAALAETTQNVKFSWPRPRQSLNPPKKNAAYSIRQLYKQHLPNGMPNTNIPSHTTETVRALESPDHRLELLSPIALRCKRVLRFHRITRGQSSLLVPEQSTLQTCPT